MVELRNSEEKSFKCLISEKVFCWLTILTKYTVIHTGENPFQYILCEKAFEVFSQLKVHQQTHNRRETIQMYAL